MATTKYTTIIHRVRIELDLTCNEYCIADIIFSLSANPDSKVQGWCFASKETMAKFMGLSKQSVHQIINSLIEKELVEKDEESRYLKTTSKWYKSVILERLRMKQSIGKESLPSVKKVSSDQSRKFTPQGKESLHNKYKYNNNDKDFFYPYKEGKQIIKEKLCDTK